MLTGLQDSLLCRPACPICDSPRHQVLFSSPYTSYPVRNFIESHYGNQGGWLNWNKLEGKDFVLCDCLDCGLIYQKYIPNEATLHEIYDVMIGPKFLYELELASLTVDNFEKIAGELDVLFRILWETSGADPISRFWLWIRPLGSRRRGDGGHSLCD